MRIEKVLAVSRNEPDEYVPVPFEADHFTVWPGGVRYDRHTLVRGDERGARAYPVFVDARMTDDEVRVALGIGAERN
jgi:hypothetical protein